MNATDLARRLKLHPRALVLTGKISERKKNSETLSGFTPHYAMKGCPIVQYQGANALEQPNTAEIEFVFNEADFPLPSILPPKSVNLAQLVFGREGQAPSQGAYRVLREAGSLLKTLADSKRDVYLVAMPVFKPGQYGVASGNLYPLAVLGAEGTPLWVHPEAQERVLTCDYPAQQKERSLAETRSEERTEREAMEEWYRPLARALQVHLKGDALHDAVISARAQQLVDRGSAPSLKAARTLIEREIQASMPQAKGRSAGKALIKLAKSPVPSPTQGRSR